MKLDWIGAIVGDSYTEEMDAAICQELGKKFVAKADFNAKLEEINGLNKQITERDKQLKTLNESAGSNEELQKTIKQLQDDNETSKKTFEKNLSELKFESALDKELLKAKAVDVDLVKVKLDRSAMKLSDSGEIIGFKEQLEGVQKEYGFLFGNTQAYRPTGGGNPNTDPSSLRDALAERYKQNE